MIWARIRSRSARRNFYGTDSNNITPYHQAVEDNIIHRVVEELEQSSDYQARRAGGAGLQPRAHDPQEGHRADAGEVRHLVHGDLAQPGRARWCMSIAMARCISATAAPRWGRGSTSRWRRWWPRRSACRSTSVKITASNTGKVPNTSATAASSGTDLNGMAALDAARPDQGADARACGADLRGRAQGRALGVRRHPRRAAIRAVRRAGDIVLDEPGAAFGGRVLLDAEDPLGSGQRDRAIRSTISPMARRAPK